MSRPEVAREDLAQVAPRSLETDEQRRFLRAVQVTPAARDRAIALLFFYTGLRLAELTNLASDDVAVSARRGRVTVRSGKGDMYREVPLNSVCREAMSDWTLDRADQVSHRQVETTAAWWLSRTGSQLTARAIDMVVRRIAKDARLSLSAHVLRHTCLTNLIRSGADIVLVAEIAGHKRLDITRRYSLPSEADLDAAVEAIVVLD